MVPAAIGSDGAGSVRIPAAWTHLVGIKPQRGRISTWPEPESFHGITVNGPLARTVADAALLFDVVAGNHNGDLHKPPPVTVRDAVGRDPGRLRIALSLRIPFTATPTALHPEIRTAVGRTAHTLRRLGHDVVVDDPEYGILLGLNFLPRSLAGIEVWLDRLPDRSLVDPRTRANGRTGACSPGGRCAPRGPPNRGCGGGSARSSTTTTWSWRPPPPRPRRASTRWTVSAVSLPTR